MFKNFTYAGSQCNRTIARAACNIVFLWNNAVPKTTGHKSMTNKLGEVDSKWRNKS